ncbi:MAG: hypothetical protein IT270_12740 [Saprospiraceae bacterium]|nr:hypothetical protein [Saprospiraceae bacterium]
MIRLFCFVVLFFGLGCGEVVPEPVYVDPGYGMSVQCVIPPKSWEGPCDLRLCNETEATEGTYRVTFSNYFLDNIDFAFPWKYCDSLPVLEFEYTEHYDSLGRPKEHAIHDWFDVAQRINLDIGDSVTFYIQLHQTYKNESFSKHCEDFWVDSSGFTVPYQMYFYRPISKGYGFRRRILSSNYVSLPRRPDIENTIINRFQFEKARFEMYKLHILKDCIGKFIFFEGTGLVGSAETLEVEFTLDTFMYRGDTIDYKFRAGFEFKNKLYRAWADGKADYDMVDCYQVSYLKNGYIPVVSLCGDGGYLLYDAKSFQEKEAQFLQCYFSYDGAIHPWLQWYVKTRYFL